MLKVKKCWYHLLQAHAISFFVTRKCQKNQRNRWLSMKIANIDREKLHIFWTTCGISMKLSSKMWLMIILKVRKNQGFTLIYFFTFAYFLKFGYSFTLVYFLKFVYFFTIAYFTFLHSYSFLNLCTFFHLFYFFPFVFYLCTFFHFF